MLRVTKVTSAGSIFFDHTGYGDCRVMSENRSRTREIPPVGGAGEEGRTDDDLVGVALGRFR